jgi:hypothetical protein
MDELAECTLPCSPDWLQLTKSVQVSKRYWTAFITFLHEIKLYSGNKFPSILVSHSFMLSSAGSSVSWSFGVLVQFVQQLLLYNLHFPYNTEDYCQFIKTLLNFGHSAFPIWVIFTINLIWHLHVWVFKTTMSKAVLNGLGAHSSPTIGNKLYCL